MESEEDNWMMDLDWMWVECGINLFKQMWSYWVPTTVGTGQPCWHRLLRNRRWRRPHRVLHSAGRRWGGSTRRSRCRTLGGHTLRGAHDTLSPLLATKEGRGGRGWSYWSTGGRLKVQVQNMWENPSMKLSELEP